MDNKPCELVKAYVGSSKDSRVFRQRDRTDGLMGREADGEREDG